MYNHSRVCGTPTSTDFSTTKNPSSSHCIMAREHLMMTKGAKEGASDARNLPNRARLTRARDGHARTDLRPWQGLRCGQGQGRLRRRQGLQQR